MNEEAARRSQSEGQLRALMTRYRSLERENGVVKERLRKSMIFAQSLKKRVAFSEMMFGELSSALQKLENYKHEGLGNGDRRDS